MEAWQLALLAWEGLKLLFVLGSGGADLMKPTPVGPMTTCQREIIQGGVASCEEDTVVFSLPDPDGHWMVRR